MGVSVREKIKSSGVWYIFISINGKRKSRKIGDKKKADEIAGKVKAKILLGEYSLSKSETKSTATFKQISIDWLENHVSHLSVSTQQRYKGLLKQHILPVIGNTLVDEIKRMTVISLLERMLKKGQAHGSIELIKNVISGVLERAIDHELIFSNPANGALKKFAQSNKKVKVDIQVFTADQVDHILTICLKYYPSYHPFFITAFRTGMRLGELLGLNWSDINWKENYIRVQRSYRNLVISPTKNKLNRSIDISPQLKNTLWKLYMVKKKQALKKGGELQQPVFRTKKGERISQNTLRSVWSKLLEKAKYDYRKFHITRHTFASLLISGNVPLVAVKEQMGHHSIQMTVDVYGQFINSGGEGITNILDNTQAAPICTHKRGKALNHQ